MKTLLLLCHFLGQSEAYKILISSFPNSHSHKSSKYPLAEALVAAGHDVAFYGELFEPYNKLPAGVRDLQIEIKDKSYDLWGVTAYKNDTNLVFVTWTIFTVPLFLAVFPWINSCKLTNALLDHHSSQVEAVKKEDWDLLIVDSIAQVSGMVLSYELEQKSGTPYIIYNTMFLDEHHVHSMGLPGPFLAPSMMPLWLTWDQNNFWDRVDLLRHYLDYLFFHHVFSDHLITRRALGDRFPDFGVAQWYADASSTFLDYPRYIDWPVPTYRGILPAGSHCHFPTATNIDLTPEIRAFVEDPNAKGVIVLGFGTYMDWTHTPPEKVRAFIDALEHFQDYNVIWLHQGEPMEVGKNIRLFNWIPQRRLLQHPRTRVFISHGGAKSSKEVLCSGVPTLFVPLFGDQVRNTMLAGRNGYALLANKFHLSKELLIDKINELLSNSSSFREAGRRARVGMSAGPISALEEAVFRTEFLIRHPQARHWLRLRSSQMGLIPRYYLDWATLVFAAALVLLLVIRGVIGSQL